MKIAILGAGMIGRTMAIDLCQKFDVTSFDISENSLQLLQSKEPRVSVQVADLENYENYLDLLDGFDYVVTAVPGFMGYKTLEAVIRAGKNVADISFFPEDSLSLDALAKEHNVTAIVDCGVAPGMSHYILGYYDAKMSIDNFECFVGGLPKVRTKPFEYKAPFSPIDVIAEYTRPARLRENGILVTKPALSDPELIDFDKIGSLEAFNTDGLRTLLQTKSHIPNMREKTLRYPGHLDLIKALMRCGFFSTETIIYDGKGISPIEFSSALLIDQWKLKPGEDEFTVMRIRISGTINDAPVNVTYDLYECNSVTTNLSSMSRSTGYTCTGSLQLIINGLFTQKGVFPPEIVGMQENCFAFIMEYLEERQVHFKMKIS